MKPSILIASPQMRDTFFEKTVILLWHHDDDGAVGVVVNRPLDQALPDVIVAPEGVDLTPYRDAKVAWGGPVDTATGTVVARRAMPEDEGWSIETHPSVASDAAPTSRVIGVTRSLDQLLSLIRAREPFILCLGYAGWGPGQLDDEVASGAWLWTDCDPGLVFDVPADERYDQALATLGLTQAGVWMQPVATD